MLEFRKYSEFDFIEVYTDFGIQLGKIIPYGKSFPELTEYCHFIYLPVDEPHHTDHLYSIYKKLKELNKTK